ncbi:hypothetical protein [Peribacillus acanthi]|uniref:hypothetical protein n=1 Tax=Peribacillus acanthi TaxID=2171554 RepID=UPI000D3E5443|nr:hypothetical protein [Peribacillus acanthi]
MDLCYYITLGADIGGRDAAKVVEPYLNELVELLDRFCNKRYSSQLDEFAPFLRVDGDVCSWNFEGCEKLRLSKKHRYITVDIGMPRSKWEGIGEKEIKEYLINNLKEALELIVNRLKKERYPVNDNVLWVDFGKVKEEFLLK